MFAYAVAVVLAAASVATATATATATGRLDGKLVPTQFLVDIAMLAPTTKVVLNNGEFTAFVREDGGFTFHGVPTGKYTLDVYSGTHSFDKLRIDYVANDKSKTRVALATISTEAPVGDSLPYPVRLEVKTPVDYFVKREGWSIMSLLSNPMLLMMAATMGMAYLLPKMTEGLDPEALKEAQQAADIFGNSGDVSQKLTQVFSGSAPAGSTTPSSKKEAKKAK